MARRRLEYVNIDDLQDADENPKLHDVVEIWHSIARHGFADVIAVDERTGQLLAGHGRKEALQWGHNLGAATPDGIVRTKDGNWQAPVLRGVRTANDAEAAALLVSLNQLTIAPGWDEGLAHLLGQYATADPEWLTGTGFSSETFAALMAEAAEPDFEPTGDEPPRLDQRNPTTCPQCSYSWRIDAGGNVETVEVVAVEHA